MRTRLTAIIAATVLAGSAMTAGSAQGTETSNSGHLAHVSASISTSRAVQPSALRDFFGMHAISAPPSAITGTQTVRLWDTDTTWQVLQPRPGTWHWKNLDARVRQAQAAGAQVLLVLGATPSWAAASISSTDAHWLEPGSASPPKSMSDWATFVAAVAKRYAGRIEAYQIWNEPTLRTFWRGTPAQLADMTAVAQRLIHAADPAAKVVAGPLLPRQSASTAKGQAWLEALAARHWPVDVLTFHGYPEAGQGPDGHAHIIAQVQSLLAQVGAPDLPLWETEVNYEQSAGKGKPLDPRTAAVWLARTYLDGLRRGVDRVYWYAYANLPTFLRVRMADPNVRTAYGVLATWLQSAQLHSCQDLPGASTVVTACEFSNPSGDFTIAWSTTPVALTLTTAMRVENLQGAVIPEVGTLDLGEAPELVTNAQPSWQSVTASLQQALQPQS